MRDNVKAAIKCVKAVFLFCVPSLVCLFAFYLEYYIVPLYSDRLHNWLLVGMYLVSALYALVFIIRKHDTPKVWILSVSFAVSPVLVCIPEYFGYFHEYDDGGFLSFSFPFVTYIAVALYALPFAAITAIASIIIKACIRKNSGHSV